MFPSRRLLKLALVALSVLTSAVRGAVANQPRVPSSSDASRLAA